MNRALWTILAVAFLSAVIAGCAPATEPNTNLTHGMAKGKIVKGQTTQLEIMEMFGGPNVMTTNKTGETVWVYNYISSSSEGKSQALYLFIYGASGSSQSSHVRSFTCIITFDEKDVVKEYEVRSAQY